MGLVAQLKEIQQNTDPAQLNRFNPDRPVVVDGSLSELITQALNIAHSRRDTTTGETYYGKANPDGDPVQGGSGLVNIMKPDSPNTPAPVRPTLESMQQDQDTVANVVAQALGEVINAKNDEGNKLSSDPLLIYAIPQGGQVTEEMNADIDMYHDSGAVDINDFVFVFTDSADPTAQAQYRPVDINQKLTDYEGRGARVYPDLQSFLAALPDIRRRK